MKHVKKLLLIGNRASAYSQVHELPGLKIRSILALRDSQLHMTLGADAEHVQVFSHTNKDEIIETIASKDFDILISNGCPFVLPISQLRRSHQLFLNVHPSFLPEGRGRHPINGAVLQDSGFIGATLHYMDDGVDTGNIVHQERLPITEDLDLGLLYHMSFALEARVFRQGMALLETADYHLSGTAQSGRGSYYTRQPDDQQVDLVQMCDEEILRRVRAFGIQTQGVVLRTNVGPIRVFEAERMTNPYLLREYAGCPPANVLVRYQDRLLVKSRDGIIKIKSYLPINETNL